MKEKKRDNNIMLLRILAMLMVVAVHYNLIFDFPETISKVFSYGAKGVGIFLMFSGYLNMISYERCNSVREFYRRKVVNIIPLYYIALLLNIIFRCFIFEEVNFNIKMVIIYLFGLQMIVPSNEFYIWNNMGALWTISVFLFFYVITPGLFKVLGSFKKAVYLFPVVYLGTMVIRKAMQIVLTRIDWVSDPIQFANWFPLNLVVVYWIGAIIYYCKKESRYKVTFIIFCSVSIILYLMKRTDFVFWGTVVASIYLILYVFKIEYPKRVIQMIACIDKYTFSIYLMHPLVLYVIEKKMGTELSPMGWELYLSIIAVIIIAVIAEKIKDKVLLISVTCKRNK